MSRDNVHRSAVMGIAFDWDGRNIFVGELNGSFKQWGSKVKTVKSEFKKLNNFNVLAMAI